ncbi:hypothetical protein KPP03845_200303 (plasmid) [Streptomyces xanthophaeus]|uniref:hypothetical protein n=1 Tax=Streptomyces xanthophaeus TaxID=67385 RepID=UPI00233F6E3E|nr:hypothetical protein [Streptomyces xanthophaeus]WCD91342.1 hypothetical protein KPP03845_200303 [Streptomyces xanthophaeus]
MTRTLEREEIKVKRLFDRLEKVEEVAEKIARREPDEAASLRGVVQETLAEAGPVRVSVAAALLEFSDHTVRTWIEEGLLTAVAKRPLRVDPARLHQVLHLVRDLRDAGHKRGLLDAVWYRLQDSALLERGDLQQSLAEMREGDLRPAMTKTEEESGTAN